MVHLSPRDSTLYQSYKKNLSDQGYRVSAKSIFDKKFVGKLQQSSSLTDAQALCNIMTANENFNLGLKDVDESCFKKIRSFEVFKLKGQWIDTPENIEKKQVQFLEEFTQLDIDTKMQYINVSNYLWLLKVYLRDWLQKGYDNIKSYAESWNKVDEVNNMNKEEQTSFLARVLESIKFHGGNFYQALSERIREFLNRGKIYPEDYLSGDPFEDENKIHLDDEDGIDSIEQHVSKNTKQLNIKNNI